MLRALPPLRGLPRVLRDAVISLVHDHDQLPEYPRFDVFLICEKKSKGVLALASKSVFQTEPNMLCAVSSTRGVRCVAFSFAPPLVSVRSRKRWKTEVEACV